MMGVQKLVNNFVAIILVFKISRENILSEKVLVHKNIVVDCTRLFRVVKIGLQNLIMLIKNAAALGDEHEVVVVVFFFSRFANKLRKR